jgi:hypothetical protein
MRSLISAMLIVTSVITLGSADAGALQTMGAGHLPPAPIGHAQPRAPDFTPGSSASQTEQNRLSTFDAQQQKLDEMLDRKLNICRC